MKRSPRVMWIETQVRQRYSKSSILDVGFVGAQQEPALHMALRGQNPDAKIVGIDINKEGVMKWHLCNTLAADAKLLPFRDGSFDAILCLEVLEHLYCPIPVFLEFRRVLRPNGELVITTPNAWSWWNFFKHWMIGSLASRTQRKVYRCYLGDADHKHFYDPLSEMNLLDEAGFETIRVETKNHSIPLLHKWFKGLDLLDYNFYPLNRLGHYLCLIARKAHLPRVSQW